MNRLWKKIICLSLVLTMLVPSQAVFAAEMPVEVPAEVVDGQEEAVLDESTNEETVPEEGAEEAVPEEGAEEEAVPEEGVEEETVPEEGAEEEAVLEEGAEEEAVPEEGAEEEAVPEEGAEEVVVPEEGAEEEVVPEEGAEEEAVPEEGAEEEAVPEEGAEEEIVPEEGTTEVVLEGTFTEEAANTTTGWVGSGDSYQYIKADGNYATEEIVLIGGQLYAFDENTYMYTEGEQYFYGYDADGNWESGYIRVQSHGGLYRNAWYENEWDEWYYYGANGLSAYGVQTIGGMKYYFYSDGQMAVNTTISYNGVDYIVDGNGFLTEVSTDGWHQVSGEWYYRQDGEFLRYGVYQINGVLYGFDSDGVWCVDTDFYGRNYDQSTYGYHRAKADGTLYINSWYYDSEYEEWYYYGTNGLAPNGVQTIGGKKYYFYSDGEIATNCTITADDTEYIADGNGFLTEVSADGWYDISGDWYYRQNGEFLEDGVYKIGNSWYAFEWNGCMHADEEFYLEGYYRAKASGVLYVNEWYQDQWGEWYYYGTEGRAPSSGLQTVGGAQYYFYSWGRIATNEIKTVNGKIYYCNASGVASLLPNGWSQQYRYEGAPLQWYYTQNGSVVNGLVNTGSGYYVFNNSCMVEAYEGIIECYDSTADVYKMYLSPDNSGKVVTKTGWNVYDGDYYFVDSDYSLHTGLLTTGGKTYYLEPVMVYSEKIAVGNTSYMADSTGALTKITTDGFYHTTDGSFYVSGGKVLTSTWKSIDGFWYYFGRSGYAYNYTIAEIDGAEYAFREDGVMAANAFVTIWGDTYYANASGVIVTGEQYISGKWYYFNEYGELEEALIESANGISVYAENGEYLGTVNGNGWKNLNGKYYYVSNGELLYGEKKTINGAEYIFDWEGWMYENEIVDWDDGYYYCAAGGAVQKNGWRQFNGSYYYADATGKLYRNGEYTIGGAKYYFDTQCKMADKDFVLNGTLYKVASSGAITSKTTASTVNLANGDVVFYQQGKPYTGWKGSKYYRSGKLMVNGVKYCGDAYYAFDKSGNYLKSTWYDSDYSWVYLKANGKAANDETMTIGGYTYAFDGYYMVANRVYQGKYYDANGHLVNTVSGNGWKQYGGEWYYLINGNVVKSRLMEIGGSTYGFSYDGAMVSGGLFYVGGKVYFFNGSGILQKYTGWKQLYGDWYYFSKDYSSFEGWLKDGGNQYYMESYGGMLTGVQLIDGVLYNFGSNGILQSSYKAANGWVKAGYDWCYVLNGKPVTGLYQISGSWYYFDGQGRMTENDWTDYGYATSSGVLIRTVGWHQLNNGKWIYIGAGNEVYHSGGYYIGGTLYVFNSNGYWV